MFMFLIINVLFVPVFYFYYSNDVMSTFESTSILDKLTLGNIGQAGPQCAHHFIGMERTLQEKMTCSKGKISQLKFAGIIPQKEAGDTFELNHCASHKEPEIEECTNTYLDI